MRRPSDPYAFLFAGLAVFLGSGCDFGAGVDRLNAFDPIVRVTQPSASLAGVVLDAQTGQPISEPVRLTFGGESAELIRDLFGHEVSAITTERGMASFGLAGNLNPQPARPVEVRILARADGYKPNALRLSISSGGRHEFRLILDRQSDPLAPSISAEDHVVTDATGRLTRGLSASAIALGNVLAQVELSSEALVAPPVSTVGLKVRYSAPSPALFATFPGGTEAGIEVDGEVTRGTLTVGALVDVSVTGPGATLIDSLRLEAIVDRSLLNPGSNEAVRAGDLVGLYRWTTHGWWESMGFSALESAQAGLRARFRIPTAGTYSVGYRTVACSSGRLNLRSNTLGGSIEAFLGSPDDAEGVRVWRFPPGASSVVLSDPPDLWRGEVVVRHGDYIERIPYDGLCGRTFDVDLGGVAAPAFAIWSLRAAGCTALRVNDLPVLGVLVRPSEAGRATAVSAVLEPAWLAVDMETERDALGRVTGLLIHERLFPGGAVLNLILGTSAWAYPAPGVRGRPIDITDFARETGLCVAQS
jgi:hypothetical protein